MSVASHLSVSQSKRGVIATLVAVFRLMRDRRAFLALSLCEVVRGFIKVPSYALGLKWITEGCLQGDAALLLAGLGVLMVAVVFATGTVVLTEYWSLRITAKTKSEIRAQLISSSITADPSQVELESTNLIYTLTNSVNDLGQLFRATDAVIGTFGKVAGSLVAGIWLSPSLSLLVLALGLAKICLDRYLLKPLQGVMSEIKDTETRLVKEVVEHLEGTIFFRIFGNEERSIAQFTKLGERFTDAHMNEARVTAVVSAANKGIEFLTMLIVLGVGGLDVVRGKMVMGALVAFISIYDDLINPYRRIGEFLKDYQLLTISYDRVAQVLSKANRVSPTAQAAGEIISANTPFSLVAEGIHFAYSDSQPVLRDISFEAPSGEVTTIVGRSGVGKTTLFKLVMGLCIPDQGRVGLLIKGRGWVAPRPELFSYVSQDPFLFTGSIRANIAMDDGKVDERRLEEATGRAGIADLIAELPEGLNTTLRDGGKDLSGGQRCRIALARAFYHDTPIILLDEVFAALDNNTIKRIKQSIGQLCRENRCVVMISHRHEWIEPGARVVEISRYSAE